jgi:hypothetical protein
VAKKILPMPDGDECPARLAIDEAATVALGLSPDEIADWRRRLAVEPKITNARAPRFGGCAEGEVWDSRRPRDRDGGTLLLHRLIESEPPDIP